MNGSWFSHGLKGKPDARSTLPCTYRCLETGRRYR